MVDADDGVSSDDANYTQALPASLACSRSTSGLKVQSEMFCASKYPGTVRNGGGCMNYVSHHSPLLNSPVAGPAGGH